ncbi:MAG: 3-oxoacyl-ACP synthase [Aureibaculum sp.]|nr:3-oxoacyl-ACP synthase [Aureibaculum sp.]
MDEKIVDLKKALYNSCVEFIEQREETINRIINSNQSALTSETKSSAGDKHETGRAMLQLEMEKTSQQLDGIHEMRLILSKIRINDISEIIKLGSVVITNRGNYFLAISAGEINILGIKYFAVSTASPIGKLLLGKSVGDAFDFNHQYVIQEVF